MFSFWQYYIGFCVLVGGFIWISSAEQGNSELAALRDGIGAFICAPMVAMLLIVSALVSKGSDDV